MPPEETKLGDGRIVRSEIPLNLEMEFSTVDSFITPTKSFYVRTHFPIPAIDRDAWWLYVAGEVGKPFSINYEELMECLVQPIKRLKIQASPQEERNGCQIPGARLAHHRQPT